MTKIRKISIDTESTKSYSEQIFDQFSQAIHGGTLLFGSKLPSIRDLSAQLKINKIGIINAYNKLSDEGFIKAKPGSGFYVTFKKNNRNLFGISKKESSNSLAVEKKLNTPQLLPQYLQLPEEFANLGGSQGYKSLSILEELRAISRVCFSNQTLIYAPEDPLGLKSLREVIAFELENKGMPIQNSDQIVICNGSLHGLNLILQGFLKHNDFIVLETPNCDAFFYSDLLKNYNVINLERSSDKIVLSDEKIIEINTKKPKAFIIYSNCHNPTSGTLSALERHLLLKIAKETNAIILEIDVFNDLNYDEFTLPSLSTIDGLNNTFYISSYENIFASGIKFAYIVANAEKIKHLKYIKLLQAISPSIIDQQIIYELIIRGTMKKHILKLKNNFRSKRDTLISMLKKLSPQGSKWNHPEAGMFLWFEFPTGVDLHIIEERALEKKISIAPGYYFSNDPKYFNYMRLNFANLEPLLMYNSLETLFSIWRTASSRKWILRNDKYS